MAEVFTHRLRVRYSECDQQGVVFNGHYLFFYDVALTEMFREVVGDYGQMVREGWDLVVAEARIRFREGARFDWRIWGRRVRSCVRCSGWRGG